MAITASLVKELREKTGAGMRCIFHQYLTFHIFYPLFTPSAYEYLQDCVPGGI